MLDWPKVLQVKASNNLSHFASSISFAPQEEEMFQQIQYF